jgi:sec-independent protein translocase protein TatB
VIGPEKLPRVARTVGHLVGRLQRYVADVKSDINREVELEELRKMRDSVQQAASSIESSVTSGLSRTEDEINRAISPETPVDTVAASAAPAPDHAIPAPAPEEKKA